MKIYTKTGDAGKTSLFGGSRVSKDDIRIESYGTVDELNSCIGVLMAEVAYSVLVEVQHRLFTIGSSLASDPSKQLITPDITEADIALLEEEMDRMNDYLAPLRAFILPSGGRAIAQAHVCRTVCRRAERRVISLAHDSEVDPLVIKYLNRLSDYFFVLSRDIAHQSGAAEVEWHART